MSLQDQPPTRSPIVPFPKLCHLCGSRLAKVMSGETGEPDTVDRGQVRFTRYFCTGCGKTSLQDARPIDPSLGGDAVQNVSFPLSAATQQSLPLLKRSDELSDAEYELALVCLRTADALLNASAPPSLLKDLLRCLYTVGVK